MSPPDFCYCRNGHGPYTSSAYHLVLGCLSFVTDKRGISAKGLARQFELSYESAWYLPVRIRKAMKDRDQNYMLEGLIEMDEAYLGPRSVGRRTGVALSVRSWLQLS